MALFCIRLLGNKYQYVPACMYLKCNGMMYEIYDTCISQIKTLFKAAVVLSKFLKNLFIICKEADWLFQNHNSGVRSCFIFIILGVPRNLSLARTF